MARIIYLHGFLSSPESFKAKATREWLEEHRPDIEFQCPFLSSDPSECLATLYEVFSVDIAVDTYVIGSSLGGFWSSLMLEEKRANRAALINPAVSPHTRFNEYAGQTLCNYYTDDTYILGDEDLQILLSCEPRQLQQIENYYLLVQEADEVLDYRHAVERYCGCKQVVEPGGDHSFKGYLDHLPGILTFFDI